MIIHIEESTREQVIKFLPAALKKALSSYEAFMASEIDNSKPETFSKHHTAGKVALAHVQLLMRLAQSVDIEIENGENHAQMMEFAMNEIKNNRFHDSLNLGEEG